MRQSDLYGLERCDGGVALKQEMLHDSIPILANLMILWIICTKFLVYFQNN